MNLFQALAYFFREAFQNLVRGWRVSSLAIATTSLSLFIGGVFLLLGANLAEAVDGWRSEARVVLYLEPDVSTQELEQLRRHLADASAVGAVREVRPEIKILVGGRCLAENPELGERIGADAHTADVDRALLVARRLVGLA